MHAAPLKLSSTRPFTWRRKNLRCQHTIFNYVASYNDYESRFATFLDDCADVLRFAALGTTEQDTATQFRVDYLKGSGAIGFYYPDWVAVQPTAEGEIRWIIETKGRVWEGTDAKDAAITAWCAAVSAQTGEAWRFVRVNQHVFDKQHYRTFAELLTAVDAANAEPAVLLPKP